MKRTDETEATFRFIFDPSARRHRWPRMTGKGKGRIQGVMAGVLLSALAVGAWHLVHRRATTRPTPDVVRAPSPEPTLWPRRKGTSFPTPTPLPPWPNRRRHVPAAYHLAGEIVMGLALGLRSSVVELHEYGGCPKCHHTNVDCVGLALDAFPIHPPQNAALVLTSGWAGAWLYGYAGSFAGPDGIDTDYMGAVVRSEMHGIPMSEIERETFRILKQPQNYRAIDRIAKHLIEHGWMMWDEATAIYARCWDTEAPALEDRREQHQASHTRPLPITHENGNDDEKRINILQARHL